MNKKPDPFEVISSSTLRDSDLLEAYIAALELYRPIKYKNLIAEGRSILEKHGDFGYIGYLDEDLQDHLSWVIHEDFSSALDDIAPAGCYFGSHPGDGALIGFWPFEESPLWE